MRGRQAGRDRCYVGLAELYRAELPALLRFLGRLGAAPADAADAAHQAFVEVCARWDTIRDPRAYLRRVARNELSRLASRHLKDVDSAVKSKSWINLDAVEDVYGSADVSGVYRCLARLPYRQRQVMAWHYDGYSVAEIAAELTMPAATVRSTLRHAKRKLRLLVDLDGREG